MDKQMVRTLQEADNILVAEAAERHGSSDPTICALRMKVDDLCEDVVKRSN
jgi:hypothetical protein